MTVTILQIQNSQKIHLPAIIKHIGHLLSDKKLRMHSTNSKYLVFFTLAMVLALGACKKDPTPISTTPEIEFISISPSTASEFNDNIKIVIGYEDGDGNIGENVADVKNLFVSKKRTNISLRFQNAAVEKL